jgi:hypothetical protein
MKAWQIFWSASLLIAGVSFACITVVVAAKGFQDLRKALRRWQEQKEQD